MMLILSVKESKGLYASVYREAQIIPVLNLRTESERPLWLTDWMRSELSWQRDDSPQSGLGTYIHMLPTVVKICTMSLM